MASERSAVTGVRTRLARIGAAVTGIAAVGIVAWNTMRPAALPSASSIPPGVTTAAPSQPPPTSAHLAASIPVRILIPGVGVDAPVIAVGNGPSGVVQLPPLADHNLAGWYEHSVTPGEEGTSLIVGHVDSYKGISVFFRIRYLKRGDIIRVLLRDGLTAVFSVDGVQLAAKDAFPAAQALGATRYASLRLVTCGGPFNDVTREYTDNIIIYAHLAT
jgi:hypothetical protein